TVEATATEVVRRRRALVTTAPSAATAATTTAATTTAATAVTSAAEELDVVGDDLGDVALLTFLVVVAAGLDAALDEDLPPLRQLLRADFGGLAPHDDAVPLGALLALTVLVLPALAGRQAELVHAGVAGRVAHVGIRTQVPDEDDFVDSASHVR